LATDYIKLDEQERRHGIYEMPDGSAWNSDPASVDIPRQGFRNDNGKTRWDLLPPDAMEYVARALTHGLTEYPERNWERGMAWCRVFGSLMRHSWAWFRGEDIDAKSGLPHMALATTNCLFLLTYQLRGIGDDNRVKVAPNG